jgi:hypothetical protein
MAPVYPCPTVDESLKMQDEAVLRALAENMHLAPSNDMLDTLHWLQEHYSMVGLTDTINWYVRCAVSRGNDSFVKQLDWKRGIVDARKHS